MFGNRMHNDSHQKIKVNVTNRTNVYNGGSSVPNSIVNYVESGGTVSDIIQSPQIQDMIPLTEFQLMEIAKKECERKLEKPKSSSMNRSKHGQNNLKREMWPATYFSNEKRLNKYCTNIYRNIKTFPDVWMRYNPKNKLSLCARAMGLVTVPKHDDNNGCDIEREFYWNNMVMPVMNKKYGDMRSSNTERLQKQFKSK